MEKKYDIIVVGSGLGGLVTATILSKEGLRVLVIEQNNQFGGNLQTFQRGTSIFSTGMNYIGALGDGEFLNTYFRYFNVFNELELSRLDLNGFEEVSFGDNDKRYRYAQGYDNFKETLSSYFPKERKSIQNYLEKIWDITDRFPLLHLDRYKSIVKGEAYMNGGVSDFIESISENLVLKNVLSATNSLYGGNKANTPLYVHALVNRQFIHSAWRFVDGSQQLVDAFLKQIRANGGELMNKTEIRKIRFEDDQSVIVESHLGEQYSAKKIISNIHPAKTLDLIEDSRLKKIYRQRIKSLPDTAGMFTVYFVLKKNSFKYLPRNIYHFKNQQVWFDEKTAWPQQLMFYTAANSQNPEWANTASVLSLMSYSEVKKWEQSFVEDRGQDYLDFKTEKAEKLIDLLEQRIPNFRSHIQTYYTSTPLTYRDYTSTRNGAAYGIQKDHQSPYQSVIMPQTSIPNLFFTGQNTNMHGALGVTASGVLAAGEILGLDYLTNKIYSSIR
ncbi:MAG: NAD(P)/FAD-dependent oxidoreductase [Bacteroidales bacterium]|nr:NAD(P)/FAD-dependent oxidoreductase [Bacteroidales bacterium]